MFSNVSYHAKAIDQREVRYGQSVYSNAIMHSFNSEQYNGPQFYYWRLKIYPFLSVVPLVKSQVFHHGLYGSAHPPVILFPLFASNEGRTKSDNHGW